MKREIPTKEHIKGGRHRRSLQGRVILVICALLFGAWAFHQFGDAWSLSFLAEREDRLRRIQESHPWSSLGGAFLLYVLATGASLPGAALLTLVIGWLFGFWKAMLLVSFASTAGATLAFLLSRFLFREWIQKRFGDRLRSFEASLSREGPFYLFTLRLIPVVPFFVINLVMGLTPLSARTFWWVSQVGMFPGTLVYVYAGSQFPSLSIIEERGAAGILSPGLISAFVMLGVLPLLIRKWLDAWKRGIASKHQRSN